MNLYAITDRCTPLETLDNGNVELVTAAGTTVALFTCQTGCTISGQSMLICLSDGTWDFSTPSCGNFDFTTNLANLYMFYFWNSLYCIISRYLSKTVQYIKQLMVVITYVEYYYLTAHKQTIMCFIAKLVVSLTADPGPVP